MSIVSAPKVGKNELIVIIILAVLAIVFFDKISKLGKNLLGSIGLGNTVKDDERERAISDVDKRVRQYFDPNYFVRTGKGAKITTPEKTKELVKAIWDSIGRFYDEPNKILSVFKQLVFKTQVSHLASIFNKTYNRDLYQWLQEKLDTDEQRRALLEIYRHIDGLQTGKP